MGAEQSTPGDAQDVTDLAEGQIAGLEDPHYDSAKPSTIAEEDDNNAMDLTSAPAPSALPLSSIGATGGPGLVTNKTTTSDSSDDRIKTSRDGWEKGTRVKLTGMVKPELEGAEAVVTGVGKKQQLYVRVAFNRKMYKLHMHNAQAMEKSSPAASEAGTARGAAEGVVNGQLFKQGHRVKLIGLKEYENGTQAVVTGVKAAKGQLFVVVSTPEKGRRVFRIHAECAEVLPGQDMEGAMTVRSPGPASPDPKHVAAAAVAGGMQFEKGMKVGIVGVDKYEGLEATVTGVGTGSRRNMLYVQASNGKLVRVWAENAVPVTETIQIM